MLKTEYQEYIREFVDMETKLEVEDTLITKLAGKCKVLQSEEDLDVDDIQDQLSKLIPKQEKNNTEWEYLISDIASLVLDEMSEAENLDVED